MARSLSTMKHRTPSVIATVLCAVSCTYAVPALTSRTATFTQVSAHSQHALRLSDGDPVHGRRAFVDLRCHACHRVAEDVTLPDYPGAWEGPLLHDLGKEPAEAVAWRIVTRIDLDPETLFETPMAESASAMTDRQLVDLVAYLRNPRAGKSN